MLFNFQKFKKNKVSKLVFCTKVPILTNLQSNQVPPHHFSVKSMHLRIILKITVA